MNVRTEFPRPGRAWVVAALAWLALGVTFGPALNRAVEEATAPLRLGSQALFWIVLLAGAVAIFVPRPWGVVVLRLGAWLVAVGGVAVAAVAAAPPIWRAVACGAGVANLALQLVPAVGDRQMDGGSYPGERRLGFRFPREAAGGVTIAVAVPTLTLTAAAGAAAASGGARVALGAVAVVLAAASVPAVMQLALLARRWMILSPRTMIVHDPYRLNQPFAIPYGHLTDIAAVEGGSTDPEDSKGLLDLRSGWKGGWVQTLHDAVAEPPQPRDLPARFDRLRPVVPKFVIGVGWPVTDPALCLRACAAKGLAVSGLAAPGASPAVRYPRLRTWRRSRRARGS